MPADPAAGARQSVPVLVLATLLTLVVFTAQALIRAPLESRERARLEAGLRDLVAPLGFDNAPAREARRLDRRAGPGVTLHTVYALRSGAMLRGVVVDVSSANGYLGAIRLRVAVRMLTSQRHGEVIAVRVLDQRETPGLGDRIETGDWLATFHGRSLAQSGDWLTARDGGGIDQMTGATVTSRAATEAVAAALRWVSVNAGALAAGNLDHD